MKHVLIAAVASLGLVSAAAAQTSTTVTTTTGGAAATTGAVTIQPEIRTKVKEYVTTNKVKSVTAPSGFTVTTGAVLPEAVEIQSFPATVGVTQYRYAVVGDQTVLVDPGSRRIVEVIR
ncbi:MAG TPA: DUF1236 domain-containing protein [Microvirga sp.]|jgi:uncharacterized protein (DUF2141 family)|nr:DUF1236 domain-containing protein [Microvirga sp.]